MKNKLNIKSIHHLALQIGTNEDYLNYLSDSIEKQYRYKKIPKKNGDKRDILVPSKEIKKVQRAILQLLNRISVHRFAHGWIKGRSTITNSQPHCKNPAKLCLDVKDCFQNISSWRIRDVYEHTLGCSPVVANLLTRLTTYGFYLPQGLPTSGALVNIVMYSMDIELASYAKANQLKYTRYGDDISFSGKYISEGQREHIKLVISSYGFRLNEKKEEYTSGGIAPIITGLNTSTAKPLVPRRYKRQVRAMEYKIFDIPDSDDNKRHLMNSAKGRKQYIEVVERDR